MEKEVFIVEHASNESCKCDFVHDVIAVFETIADANKWIDQIKSEIEDKTSPYFNGCEGYVPSSLEEDSNGENMGYERFVCYKWVSESGADCYTKFYITKKRFYEEYKKVD